MSQSGCSQYVATQEYASRTPFQKFDRRYLQIPFDCGNHDQVIVPGSNDFEDGEFVEPGFFDKVELSLCIRVLGLGEWKYEMRREAQEILPFLYLGPVMCVKNRDFLYKEHFTLLLSIRTTQTAQARLVSGERAAYEIDAESDSVDIVDNRDLVSVFPRAIRRINDHMSAPATPGNFQSQQPRKVLVFCESGNERSAVVVAAYLMAMFNLRAETALYVVQQRRFCVNIEAHLWHILCCFDSILKAKRDVEKERRSESTDSTSQGPLLASTSSKKRNLNDRDDDAITRDGMDIDDIESDRTPLAPFRDR